MLTPPLRTMQPGANGSPMQSAANAQATQAQTQANLVGATQGGKRRRRRGGATLGASIIPQPYPSAMVNGTSQQQVGTQQVGEQMGVQAKGDQVPLVPAPSTGGKKMRKSRKVRKSRKSRKSKKSRKSRKGRK